MKRNQTGMQVSVWFAVALALIALVVAGLAAREEPEARAVRERIAIDTREDSYFYNGADLYFYSDGHSTQVGHIDGATGNLDVEGTLNVAGAVTMAGAQDFQSTLNVDGAVTFNSTLDVDGNITSGTGSVTVTDSVNITGAVDMDSTVNADGAVTLNSTVDIDGNITSGTGSVTVTDSVNITGAVDMDSTVNADGAVTLNSTVDIDGNISSGTGGITLADTVNATGAVDFDSTLNVDGAVTFQGAFYPGFTNETVTDGETITPTYTTYALDSAGNVTITLAATGTEGQLLVLIGDDANNITINDTNVRTNDGGVQVIGQYDVIVWVYQDSEWLEISESNNS